MRPSPITETDTNYWDRQHYRVEAADLLARDLATANRGQTGADYRILSHSAPALRMEALREIRTRT